MMIERRKILLAMGGLMLFASTAFAQVSSDSLTVDAVVTRVQARGIYVQVDSPPWSAGDSLRLVFRDLEQGVRVAGRTSSSLLLAWLGASIGLEAGNSVTLTGPAPVATEAEEGGAPVIERGSVLSAPGTRVSTASAEGVRLSGYYNASVTAAFSDVRGQFTDNRSTSRSWATPVSSVRLRATGLPLNTRLSVYFRGAHRLSSQPISGDATLLQLFELSLENGASSSRMQYTVGRFRDEYSPMGGYWDGIQTAVRLGRSRVGVAGGFEPDRYTEGFRTDTKKASAFADISFRSGEQSTTLTTTLGLISNDVLPSAYTYVSLDQRTRWRGARLSSTFQMDRAPADGSWTLSRLYTRLTVPLSAKLFLNARYGTRQYFAYWLPSADFSSRRVQMSAGMQYRLNNHMFGLTATSNQFSGNERNMSLATFVQTRPDWLPFQLSNSSSVWSRSTGETLYSSTSFQRDVRRMTLGAEYSILLVNGLGPLDISYIAGLSFRVSLDRWGYLSVRQRAHIGSSIFSSTTFFNYGYSF